jgi:hypothetical protein
MQHGDDKIIDTVMLMANPTVSQQLLNYKGHRHDFTVQAYTFHNLPLFLSIVIFASAVSRATHITQEMTHDAFGNCLIPTIIY